MPLVRLVSGGACPPICAAFRIRVTKKRILSHDWDQQANLPGLVPIPLALAAASSDFHRPLSLSCGRWTLNPGGGGGGICSNDSGNDEDGSNRPHPVREASLRARRRSSPRPRGAAAKGEEVSWGVKSDFLNS